MYYKPQKKKNKTTTNFSLHNNLKYVLNSVAKKKRETEKNQACMSGWMNEQKMFV